MMTQLSSNPLRLVSHSSNWPYPYLTFLVAKLTDAEKKAKKKAKKAAAVKPTDDKKGTDFPSAALTLTHTFC